MLILLAAGGTGGHLFPAEALAAALARRGAEIELATDMRAARYGVHFPARAIHVIRSDTLRAGHPLALARTAARLGLGFLQAWRLLGRTRPDAVVGFGGYPTVPPLLAAAVRGIPTVIHEQNAVMGRANRLLAPRVTAIATGFPGVVARGVATGNPLRPAVIDASRTPYDSPRPGADRRLLVFGGSQGARVMADIVPAAIGGLDASLRARLRVVQQARDEDLARVRADYAKAGVEAEVAPFFTDLPQRMASAHLVISRAGAGTVAELAAIGRPAILVPLPHALDQDQKANAGVLAAAGGAIRVAQDDFTAGWLAGELAALDEAPQCLADMAGAAGMVGALDAAERLADLVVSVAARRGTT